MRSPPDPHPAKSSSLRTGVLITDSQGDAGPVLQMIRRLFLTQHMAGRIEDRGHAMAKYQRYCEEVAEAVPADRLLTYDVSEGWEPHCDFLDCAVPERPFPARNSRPAFRRRAGLDQGNA